MRNLIKSGDIIIAVIILSLTAFLLMLPCFGSADFAVIYVNGNEYARYNLRKTQIEVVELITEFGQNTVVIEKGQVSVTESSCKDKLEITTGHINKQGQSLVCLPNKVVVTIEGGEKTDAATF